MRKKHPKVKLVYIGETGGKFAYIAKDSKLFDELHFISAGKLRRYHGESFLTKLFDVKTNILNIRDFFRLFRGLFQAYRLLGRIKPTAMLLKGGFVCVPVAAAGRLHHVPYITHDSDALPGLSNRLAARWARYHATAMPAEYYNYPKKTIRVVGVPTDARFRQYTVAEQERIRADLKLSKSDPVLLITGGSNGARRLNEAVIGILPELLELHPRLRVLHQIGAGNDDQMAHVSESVKKHIHFFAFSSELFRMSAIADVVIARAGASALADFAIQKKACVIVPNPYLTGGHQLKNATVYHDAGAAIVVSEDELEANPNTLLRAVDTLLTDKALRKELADHMYALQGKRQPAADLADLLLEIAE